MLFDNLSEMKAAVFSGFEEIQSLMNNTCRNVPYSKGIYFVLYTESKIDFLTTSVGGHFKHKDPTVPVDKLIEKWVDNTLVVYIGQTGGGTSGENLNNRLTTLMRFGQGDAVGHWGGRYLWQIKNNRKMKICWKPILDEDPEKVEKSLIKDFEIHYGKKPFANIRG